MEPAVLPPEQTPPDRRQRLLAWVRRHPIRTIIIGLSAFLVVDVSLLPYSELRRLSTERPGMTAFQRSYRDREAAAGRAGTIRTFWVPYSSIAPVLIDAVIVAEDGTFWSHGGFDWFEFKESLARNIREARAARGASTITQQLVKNLFLSASKNPLRKLNEWILTWYAEHVLSKRRILELYLNVIEWGPGLYGIGAAAQTYFGKPASELSRPEALHLAAVIPNPRRYNPVGGTRVVERRAATIGLRLEARDRARGRAEAPVIPDLPDLPEGTEDTLSSAPRSFTPSHGDSTRGSVADSVASDSTDSQR